MTPTPPPAPPSSPSDAHYLKCYKELLEDKLNLRLKNPKSYNDHIDKLKEALKNIGECIKRIKYNKCCGDIPDPVYNEYPVPQSIPDPGTTAKEMNVKDIAIAVGIGAGVVLLAALASGGTAAPAAAALVIAAIGAKQSLNNNKNDNNII